VKIGLVGMNTTSINPSSGALETVIYHLGHELALLGLDVGFIEINTPSNGASSSIPHLHVSTPAQLSKLSSKFDLLHMHNNPAYVLNSSLPSLVTFHNGNSSAWRDSSAVSQETLKLAASKAEGLSAVSSALAIHVQQFLRVNPVLCSYPSPDPVFLSCEVPEFSKRHGVIYAGRVLPNKGLELLLQLATHPKLKTMPFTVTGFTPQGPSHYSRSILRKFSTLSNVTVTPSSGSQPDLAALIAQHRAGILLSATASQTQNSFFEGFGLSSVITQHTGANMLVSPSGGLPETSEGLLTVLSEAEFENIENIVTKLIKVYETSPSHPRPTLQTARFTPQKSAQRFVQIYSTLLS